MSQKKLAIFGLLSTLSISSGMGMGSAAQPDYAANPNCAQWQGATCNKCAYRYIQNGGSCEKVNPLCNTFDNATGKCQVCYPGYKICNEGCIPEKDKPADQLCKTFRNGACTECSQGSVMKGGACAAVNPNCKTADTAGNCATCYAGYKNQGASCVVDTTFGAGPDASQANPLCAEFRNGKCTKCSNRSYDDGTKCVAVDPQCKEFNAAACTSCYPGYALQGTKCAVDPNQPAQGQQGQQPQGQQPWGQQGQQPQGQQGQQPQPQPDYSKGDPFCAEFLNGKCKKCAFRAYNDGTKCVAVDSQCKDYNNSSCTSCYPGYALQGNNCVVVPQTTGAIPAGPDPAASDPLCSTFENGKCTKCANRAYNNGQKCVAANSVCKDFNGASCTTCYPGYALQGNNCVVTQAPAPESPSYGQPQYGQPQYGQPQAQQPQWGLPQAQQPQAQQPQAQQPQAQQPQWGLPQAQQPGVSVVPSQTIQFPAISPSQTQQLPTIAPSLTVTPADGGDIYCKVSANGRCQKCFSGFIVGPQGVCVVDPNPSCP